MAEPWPDLGVLALLVAISEQGSLSAASRAVEMAQPNASRALARLERQLGFSLLNRSPRGSELTTAGKVVVDWARTTLDAAADLMSGAEALRAGVRAQIRVGASLTIAEYLMPSWLTELRRRHLDLRIGLEVHNSAEVVEAVRNGPADVGFIETPVIPQGLHSSTVAVDELVVVVGPTHPWARLRRALTVGELASTALVAREAGSGTRQALAQALRGLPTADPTLEFNSNAAVRVSVASGVAPAVLSRLAVRTALQSGELVALQVSDLDLRRRLRAVWRPPGRPEGAVAELIRIARRHGRRPAASTE